MKITRVKQDKRIDPVDDMPQFIIEYPDGEITQVEARDYEEAKMIGEDFDRERLNG